MNKSLTKKLFDDFPKLYRGIAKPITESSLPFGFGCGDGWYQLIYILSADIENVAKHHAIDQNSEQWPEVTQVKEKFGTLRFYIKCQALDIQKEVHRLISEAEFKSVTICEQCGAPGKIRFGSWLKTTCDACKDIK